ncbi:MAG: hypothetical protein KGS72_17200 [Cyanobacteria bacterium REEB67]|nr:hypothetical protein [Cyanobacteria bacterium REEB67]
MNGFLYYLEVTPLAYPYLIGVGAALVTALSVLEHTRRCKRLVKFLSGPVPKLNEISAIRNFEGRHAELTDHADNAACLAIFSGFVAILLTCYIWRVAETNQLRPLIFLGALQLFNLFQYICGGGRYASQARDMLEERPDLGCLKYVEKLPPLPSKASEKAEVEKLFQGSLDDYVTAFAITPAMAQSRCNAPLEQAYRQTLSDAQWKASQEERPQVNEKVLLVWRDSAKNRIKVLVTTVKKIEDVAIPGAIPRSGNALITAAGEKFCGGRLAYYCGKPTQKIERGWLATADRAHILLASLQWLDDDQRELCYQLINPGTPLPRAEDWRPI